MKRNHKSMIYQSRLHLLVTAFFVVVPFVFFLLFAQICRLDQRVLLSDVAVSTVRIFAAYLVSVLLAWTWAVLFYRGRAASVALPFFDVLQSFPTFAALPLAVTFLGSTNFTVIFFLVFTIIWPIFFTTVSSLKLIRPDYHETVQIYGVHGWDYLRYFLLPASIPGVITGTIIGLGEGWEAVVATEIIVLVHGGLGYFFEKASSNSTVTMFGILGLLLFIFSINKLIWLPLLEWSHRKLEE